MRTVPSRPAVRIRRPVGAERGGGQLARVAAEKGDRIAVRYVPDSGTRGPGSDDPAAVRAEGRCRHRPVVALKRLGLPGRDVPDARLVVEARGHDQPSVVTERDPGHAARVPRQKTNDAARPGVEQPGDAVLPGSADQMSIGAEGCGVERFAAADQQQPPEGGDAPDPDGALHRRRGQVPAVMADARAARSRRCGRCERASPSMRSRHEAHRSRRR